MPFDLVREAERLIGVNSVSAAGTGALVEHLMPLLEGLDLAVSTQSLALQGVRQVNLIAEKEGGGRDGLLLVTHLDTVPPGDPALWTETGGDPFRATRKEDRLYGLGSADAKVDFLCKLKAVERFAGTPFRERLELLGTFGEEIGLLGSRHFLESKLVDCRYALIGEPTNLEIVFAHKGYLVWEAVFLPGPADPGTGPDDLVSIVFLGEESHSSTPHLGRNAIDRAVEWLERAAERNGGGPLLHHIEAGDAVNRVPSRCVLSVERTALLENPPEPYEGSVEAGQARPSTNVLHASTLIAFRAALSEARREIEAETDERFDPPRATMNLGRLWSTGRDFRAEFDCRPLPQADLDTVFKRVDKIQAQVSRLPQGGQVIIQNDRTNPAFETPESGSLVRRSVEALSSLGLPSRTATKAGCTEAGIFASMGLEAVVFGPGVAYGNAHRPNERTRISQMESAVEFYARLIETLCL